ncbi:MAG: apolipoprotein N-acyltransferase [Pseudomonadota bacterium]
MNQLSTEKVLYAILSGVMLTASFPPGGLDWLAWFALVPLLKSLGNSTPYQALKLGFIAGFTHYLTLLYWIILVLQTYGGLNPIISLGALLLLGLYLALYLALFSCFCSYGRKSGFAVLTAAGFWVGLEYIRAKALTGFPWCLLGYTQYRHLELIQIADLVGVYGISFLIVLVNVLLYTVFFDRDFEKTGLLKWDIVFAVVIAFLTFTYGQYCLGKAHEREGKGQPSVKMAIVQGNIDQSMKWHPAYQKKTLQIYQGLTRSARVFNPQLVVWPETAVPFFFQDNPELSLRVIRTSRESGAWLIFGSPAYGRDVDGTKFYNRAYLLSPDGELTGYYDKVHLVPFGEYVPLKWFFPFIHRLVQAAGDFASGEMTAPLNLPSFSAGVLICFEVIFPDLARIRVKDGAGVLVNLTNDAWFGMTSAPHQHLSMAVFRAVENRRPLIRAANTGISAFISPEGKIDIQGGLFMEEVLTYEVGLCGPLKGFYTQYGDVLPISALGIILIKILYALCYNSFIFRPLRKKR